ncbi:hypothetical protein [Runella sp.]|uniref:hypothetical protein n=1 Tax=Runella sp. TaxID=1960881 RepID=UPI003D0CFFD8
MKAIISRLLLTIYLFSATEFSQLLKLPVLIIHFQEHQQKNPSISFFQFLHHHYAINHADDGDAERDNQLPFQSHDNCSSFQAPIYLFLTFVPLTPSVVILSKEKTSFYSDSHLLSAHLDSIWQPPQFV